MCMDFRFPYHEKSGAEAPNKVSLPHPLQGVLRIRVHSPLVGVCDPSSIGRHWVPDEPPVGSAILQVGSSSDWCAS